MTDSKIVAPATSGGAKEAVASSELLARVQSSCDDGLPALIRGWKHYVTNHKAIRTRRPKHEEHKELLGQLHRLKNIHFTTRN
jgi:hypothetical protein